MPRSNTQLLVSPYPREPQLPVKVQFVPQRSKLSQRIASLLGKAGLGVANTVFVASVDFPLK